MNGLIYPKKSGGDATNEYGDGDLRHVTFETAGPPATTDGPTSSPRAYPKKGPTGGIKMNTSLNPQKIPVTTIYVGGVD